MIARLAIAAALAVLPTAAFAAEGETIDKAYNSTWTAPCDIGSPEPLQCMLDILDNPKAGQKFAIFRVATRDIHNDRKCGFAFPVVMNTDGQLITATKDFTLTITYRGSAGLNVMGLPDSLCGLPLNGTYSELGD